MYIYREDDNAYIVRCEQLRNLCKGNKGILRTAPATLLEAENSFQEQMKNSWVKACRYLQSSVGVLHDGTEDLGSGMQECRCGREGTWGTIKDDLGSEHLIYWKAILTTYLKPPVLLFT